MPQGRCFHARFQSDMQMLHQISSKLTKLRGTRGDENEARISTENMLRERLGRKVWTKSCSIPPWRYSLYRVIERIVAYRGASCTNGATKRRKVSLCMCSVLVLALDRMHFRGFRDISYLSYVATSGVFGEDFYLPHTAIPPLPNSIYNHIHRVGVVERPG